MPPLDGVSSEGLTLDLMRGLRERQTLADLTTLFFSWRVLLPASGTVNTKANVAPKQLGLRSGGRQPRGSRPAQDEQVPHDAQMIQTPPWRSWVTDCNSPGQTMTMARES